VPSLLQPHVSRCCSGCGTHRTFANVDLLVEEANGIVLALSSDMAELLQLWMATSGRER
jgi:hypothetical protein